MTQKGQLVYLLINFYDAKSNKSLDREYTYNVNNMSEKAMKVSVISDFKAWLTRGGVTPNGEGTVSIVRNTGKETLFTGKV